MSQNALSDREVDLLINAINGKKKMNRRRRERFSPLRWIVRTWNVLMNKWEKYLFQDGEK